MVKGKLRTLDDGSVGFKCPGCGEWHFLARRPSKSGPSWDFNEDYEKPTFSPSILMLSSHKGQKVCCHSYVTDGKIRFLDDCTHGLVGQTVELPDMEK